MRVSRPGRAGFAVVAVLLLLIGLTALAHAALVVATRERQASALEARLIARRLAARGVALRPPFADTVPTLGIAPATIASGARDPLRWRVDALALGGELMLVRGTAELEGLSGEARSATLGWRLDPSARAAAAAAVVEVGGGAQLDGLVSSAAWLEPEQLGGEPALAVCQGELRALDSLGARVPPAVAPLAAATLPGLGLIPGDSLLARAPLRVVGGLTPTAVVEWRECVSSPSNWGSPSDVLGPCGPRFVHVGAAGDLTLLGGEGQGLLIVAGSLHLAQAARFHGVALIAGDLLIEDGSLVGAARVGGAVRVTGRGRIDGSACAVARALRALPSARAPLLLPGGRVHPA